MTRAARLVLCALLLAGLTLPPRAAAAGGIRGRTSLGGVLVEGLAVKAYPYRSGTFGPLTGTAPAAEARTGTDGTYELTLEPGQYVVEGLKKAPANRDARPEAGDLHCLYSGSPVSVVAGAWTAVGLNLVEVAKETRRAAERSSLSGRITRGGEPVQKVYLYVYQDAASAFRGPAHLLQPVADGSFRVRVPPGTYHLVARKRARGGAYGPVEIGDLFNFYSRNPVTVGEGQEVSLEIPLVERLSQLEEEPGTYHGLPVRVVDASGKGVGGIYVLAYGAAARMGPPLVTSSPTDADGRTHIVLAPGATSYLRARRSLGGPLQEGEEFADGESPGGNRMEVVLTLGADP